MSKTVSRPPSGPDATTPPPGARPAPLRHHRRRHGWHCVRPHPGAGRPPRHGVRAGRCARGRTATVNTVFGPFDIGAQYFTVRDPRFARAIDTVPGLCSPGAQTTSACWTPPAGLPSQGLLSREAHWVPAPAYNRWWLPGRSHCNGGSGTAQHTSAARGARQPEPQAGNCAPKARMAPSMCMRDLMQCCSASPPRQRRRCWSSRPLTAL